MAGNHRQAAEVHDQPQRPLGDKNYGIFFDASGLARPVRGDGGEGGKAIYCEKPTRHHRRALRLAKLCEDAKLKNGVVQDKLWLPASQIKTYASRILRRILSVRGDFGYWSSPAIDDQPASAQLELPPRGGAAS